jgi:hypothetical protein
MLEVGKSKMKAFAGCGNRRHRVISCKRLRRCILGKADAELENFG